VIKIHFKGSKHITNRSNKNMLPLPILNFGNLNYLDTIVEIKKLQKW